MSQFSAYKKETLKKSSKRRDTSIGKLELNDFKNTLEIFKDEPSGPSGLDKSKKKILGKNHTMSGHSPDIVQTQSGPMKLTDIQYKVYNFFLNNGVEGSFNRTIISEKTNVTRASVKAAIVKFQKKKVIEIGSLCPISKVQTYKLNLSVKVSGHSPDTVQTQSGSIEISEFWKKAGLTIQKCEEWISAIPGLNPERLQLQLQYGEHTDLVIKAKKGPISYIYGCLKGNPLIKPTGYKTTEDQYVEIMQQQIKEVTKKQEVIEALENARQKEREIADQESFLAFLRDFDAVEFAIDEIAEGFMTPTLKASVNIFRNNKKIDTRLESRLRLYFQKS